MRSVERLIRQLTNARISVVRDEQRRDLKGVKESIPLADAPVELRRAVKRLKAIDAEKAKLLALIRRNRFRDYMHDLERGKLYRTDSGQETAAINRRGDERVARIEALRAEALIDTIGTTPEQAKAALVAFRAAIVKV